MDELQIVLDNEKEIIELSDWEILTDKGYKSFSGIKKSQHDKSITLTFSNGNKITSTLAHKYKTDSDWICANDLEIGNTIYDGITIVDKVFNQGDIDVYDILGVEGTKSFYTNNIVSSNCAFIPQIEDIWTSAYPALSRGGSVIIISTPAGQGNFFYETFTNAGDGVPKDKKNEFNRFFCHWTLIPEYRGFDDTTGMTFEQIVEKAKQCDWYKRMRPQFDDRRWAQEFEGDFLGSGNTVVDPNVLKQTKFQMMPPIRKMNIYLKDDHAGELWIWKEPERGHFYIIGADISTGDGSDYNAVQILDIRTGEQVAEYQGRCDMMTYAHFLAKVSTYYNTGLLVPEVTGLGAGVVQKLVYEIGYDNIFVFHNELTMKKKKRTHGWKTSATSRPLLIQAIQNYFNGMEFKWYSSRLWHELSAFVWVDGKPQADGGNKDDLVMSFAIAAHNRITAMYLFPLGLTQSQSEEINLDNVNEFGELNWKKEQDNQDIDVDNFTPTIQSDRYDGVDTDILDWLRS